jgi:hypothetical protein
MSISKPIETDLGGVWILEDADANVVAEVDLTRLSDGRRLVKYCDGAGTVHREVPANDTRGDDDLARDVFLLRGKTTTPVFRKKAR